MQFVVGSVCRARVVLLRSVWAKEIETFQYDRWVCERCTFMLSTRHHHHRRSMCFATIIVYATTSSHSFTLFFSVRRCCFRHCNFLVASTFFSLSSILSCSQCIFSILNVSSTQALTPSKSAVKLKEFSRARTHCACLRLSWCTCVHFVHYCVQLKLTD